MVESAAVSGTITVRLSAFFMFLASIDASPAAPNRPCLGSRMRFSE